MCFKTLTQGPRETRSNLRIIKINRYLSKASLKIKIPVPIKIAMLGISPSWGSQTICRLNQSWRKEKIFVLRPMNSRLWMDQVWRGKKIDIRPIRQWPRVAKATFQNISWKNKALPIFIWFQYHKKDYGDCTFKHFIAVFNWKAFWSWWGPQCRSLQL